MKSVAIEAGEFLYEVSANITGVTEFGVSLQALLAGQVDPPGAGARFDVAVEGMISGPRLQGKVCGVDYAYVRADRRIQMHIHAQINTGDSHNIAYFAEGPLILQAGTTVALAKESASFITASPTYAWLNHLLGWGLGTVDFATGEIMVKMYAA